MAVSESFIHNAPVLSNHAFRVSNPARMVSNEVNWPHILRYFGAQFDMSLAGTLRFISERNSLEVACDLIGIALSPGIGSHYTDADVQLLSGLGDVLSARGYRVPRLMERHRLEYGRRDREQMGFSLSREEYLRERATGKSKNKIAKQQGISGPALFHWLNKWGLKDVAVEQRELLALEPSLLQQDVSIAVQGSDSPQSLVSPAQIASARSQAPSVQHGGTSETQPTSETSRTSKTPLLAGETTSLVAAQLLEVTQSCESSQPLEATQPLAATQRLEQTLPAAVELCLSPVNHVLPAAINTQALSRDELLCTGLVLMETALARASQELAGLLGPSAAREHLQQYVSYHASIKR